MDEPILWPKLCTSLEYEKKTQKISQLFNFVAWPKKTEMHIWKCVHDYSCNRYLSLVEWLVLSAVY